MVIEHSRLAHRSGILKLRDGLLLDGQDDAVLAAYSDGAGSLLDGFEGVVDLRGRES